MDQAELTARELLRVSRDKSGVERSNEQQQRDNHRRWSFRFVGEPYREVGSASKFARKARDEFPVLLADLESGGFDADVLVMWEGTRGSRKVSEYVKLIDNCDAVGVLIAITEHERVYNPKNARDRKELIDIANDAEYESGKISARTRRDAAEVAASGTPIGPAPLGYRRVYDSETKEFLRLEPHPEEAPIIRELFALLAQGHSSREVARVFAERGWTTRRGNALVPSELTRIAKRVAYIGLRSHLSIDDWRNLTPAERLQQQSAVDAWEPLVPETQFWAVQKIIRNPDRLTSDRPFRATHAYSITIRCGACTGPLGVVKYRSPEGHYWCQKQGCCMVAKPPVDAILDAAIVGYLSRSDIVARALGDGKVDDAEVEAARGDVARIRAERDELYASVGRGEASATMQAVAEPMILARLADAERRVAELSTPSELRGLIEPGSNVAERWAAMPVPGKRRLVKLLLSPAVLGEVRIMPNPKGNGQVRLPPEERIVWIVQCPDCGFQGTLAELDDHSH